MQLERAWKEQYNDYAMILHFNEIGCGPDDRRRRRCMLFLGIDAAVWPVDRPYVRAGLKE